MSEPLPEAAWQLLSARLTQPQDAPLQPLTLATVDETGAPDARTVLLSSFDREGLTFHTDSRSRKVAQLRAHPHVALSALWPALPRQLVVQGVASPQEAPRAEAAYAVRTPYLRRLAWINDEDAAAADDHARRARWAALDLSDDTAPPPTWVGYLVRPTRLTFWTPAADAPSRREEFTLSSAGGWTHVFLPG